MTKRGLDIHLEGLDIPPLPPGGARRFRQAFRQALETEFGRNPHAETPGNSMQTRALRDRVQVIAHDVHGRIQRGK